MNANHTTTHFKRALPHSKRSGSLIITAILAGFMIGFLALVTDIGWMYFQHQRLQSAVNAGWKAGNDLITSDRGRNVPVNLASISARVKSVIRMNGYETEADDASISTDANGGIYVSANSSFGLFFARVMNINTATVAAKRMTQRGGPAIIPLALPNGELSLDPHGHRGFDFTFFGPNEGFIPGNNYILKRPGAGGNPNSIDDSTGSSNNGAVDPGNTEYGQGGDVFRERFVSGYTNTQLSVGNLISTEPGTMQGPTSDGVDAHVGERVVVMITDIPASSSATIYDYNGRQIEKIRIIGFAEFEILPSEHGDRPGLVLGQFIRYWVKPGDVPLG
ncbi:MAG: Tad domain-containing protein [Candidatus Ozemobacteraceae bacterium]